MTKTDSVVDFINELKNQPEGIERDIFLFRWKWEHCPDAGLFSTAHSGDCAGNLLKYLDGSLTWEDTTVINNKRVVLEYEKNFIHFAQSVKDSLTLP